MTDKLYRIKEPGEWRRRGGWELETLLGTYLVQLSLDGYSWHWNLIHGIGGGKKRTASQAKAAAEAHYYERMREGLEEVDFTKEYEEGRENGYTAGYHDGLEMGMKHESEDLTND